jgi:hypothetical protein
MHPPLSRPIHRRCVPLIIQPAVLQPYHDVLPYEAFSITVGADAIPRLHKLLAAVTPAQHEALREGVRHFAAAFSWGQGGRAYEMTRYSLCLRSGRPSGCARLEPPLVRQRRRADAPAIKAAALWDGLRATDRGRIDASMVRVRNGKVIAGNAADLQRG